MNPHNSILNLHALAPEVLMYESALVDALAEVEAAINGTSIESVITELLSKPYLLEFLMSGKFNYAYTCATIVMLRRNNSIPCHRKPHN